MATEIVIWNGGTGVPAGYSAIEPGDAFLTRYVKTHSDVVYIHKEHDRPRYRRNRYGNGYTRIVSYFAPADVVAEAMKKARLHAVKTSAAKAVRDRRKLLALGSQEVAKIFLSLDVETRSTVFRAYRLEFGEKKAEYLRRVYARWQTGDVSIASEMRERLLMFLPPLLSLQDKYAIVKALWNGARLQDTVHLTLSTDSQISTAIAPAQWRLREIRETGFPVAVASAVNWLTSDDAQLAVQLIDRFGHEEDRQVSEVLQTTLEEMQNFLLRHGTSGSAFHEVKVPGLRITIEMKGATVADNTGRGIAARSDASPLQRHEYATLARIENPNDLLGDALRQLSPEMSQEVLATAANAALDIQIKQKKAELDLLISRTKMELATQLVDRPIQPGVAVDLVDEHRSENGYTRIHVERKRGLLSWLLG